MRVHTLTDCRDDDALVAAGLPAWSSSTERFLWCEACGREVPAFFSAKARKGPEPVGDFVALVRGLGSVVDRGEDEEPIPQELLEGLTSEFPCMECEQRAACYPRGDAKGLGLAESRLTPVSFHDFYALALPLMELEFDEAADLISGASAADLAKRHGGSWTSPALRRIKEEALGTGGARDPLEALRRKLAMLTQAVRAVARLSESSAGPHLHLSPAHLLVRMEAGEPVVKLSSPGAARPLRGLFLPPVDPTPPFAAPAMVDTTFGEELSVRVHVGKVWSGTGETFFGAVVEGDGLPIDQVEETDEIRIVLSVPGWEETEIWAHPLPGEGDDRASLAIATTPADLSAEQVNDLEEAKGRAPVFGTLTAYRSFGVPFDVHALGMLLFRVLLANEVQSFERVVAELVEPLSAGLELFSRNRPGARLEEFSEMLHEELGRDPNSRLTDSRNVWAYPDRTDASAIPEDTWRELLTIGLRAVTHIEGFSFCASDREDGESSPVRALLDELTRIGESLPEEVDAEAPPVAVVEDEEIVAAAQPLTETEIREITGELESKRQKTIDELTQKLKESEASRAALEGAWNEFYENMAGTKDSEGPPRDPDDARVSILATTAGETIECIMQVFKGIAHFGGDELGESVPKLRMMIQDALRETEGGKVTPEKHVKEIKRQLKVIRHFLFGVVQVFLEAHSHSTKLGTKSLMRLMEKGLFEPVTKGKKERGPDVAEVNRRFQQLAETLPEKYQRVFQPFFQEYVREKLKKAT
jgi:hypothetical protein